jgi:hypothetical protein
MRRTPLVAAPTESGEPAAKPFVAFEKHAPERCQQGINFVMPSCGKLIGRHSLASVSAG